MPSARTRNGSHVVCPCLGRRLDATLTVDGPLPRLAVPPDYNSGPLKVAPTQSPRQVTDIGRRELLLVRSHVCFPFRTRAPHDVVLVLHRTTRDSEPQRLHTLEAPFTHGPLGGVCACVCLQPESATRPETASDQPATVPLNLGEGLDRNCAFSQTRSQRDLHLSKTCACVQEKGNHTGAAHTRPRPPPRVGVTPTQRLCCAGRSVGV